MKQRKLLSLLLAAVMVLAMLVPAAATGTKAPAPGSIVILHTNDVHCSIDQSVEEDNTVSAIGYAGVAALKAEGRPFKGVIYFGLMLTKDGPRVVEYNARFGDPECQVVLSLLDSDLMDIFTACREGTLDQLDLRWKDSAACCLVLASGGYPLDYRKGFPISGLEEAGKSAVVFHAGTAEKDGQIVTSGGRVLGVTALGDTLDQAIDNAYAAAKPISFTDMHFRTDIGRAF